MLPKTVFLTISAMLFISLPLDAAPSGTATPQTATNSLSDIFIFAYPGKICPGGSERFKGPGQVLAAESGAVYCRFMRKAFPVSKSSSNTCPQGTKPYSDPRDKPDADVIWCQTDPGYRADIPSLSPQPAKAK
jgi:hypothetical protein